MERDSTEAHLRTLTDKLTALDQSISTLSEQLNQMEGVDEETIESHQRYRDALSIKRKAVEMKLEELSAADEGLWDKLQAGFDEVWQDLTETFDRATAEFEAGQQMQDSPSAKQ